MLQALIDITGLPCLQLVVQHIHLYRVLLLTLQLLPSRNPLITVMESMMLISLWFFRSR